MLADCSFFLSVALIPLFYSDISSLAVCFAIDICTWQTVAVLHEWGLKHVMHAAVLVCWQNAASEKGALVAAGLHRHDMMCLGHGVQ